MEHGAHRGDLAAPQAVNNVMSERLSHLQGEEKKGSVKKKKENQHTLPLKSSANTLSQGLCPFPLMLFE